DPSRYQTVYASEAGAVAAPTAGLHFTRELLEQAKGQGVEIASLTLHVGPGTFKPVKAEAIDQHRMHGERFQIPVPCALAIARARQRGRRVIAVGTTSTRALEAAAMPDGTLLSTAGTTDLFIRPGYRFKVVDGLITNFHLPKSTLLMLVAAFAEHVGLGGLERIREAYDLAIAQQYRFYSFGDAMLLLGDLGSDG
ncbi:MAG: S-adenosylmethionine:tRNA ribosyltransferase-isomerase, partial [Cyanobacteria bacterium REEB65]|nr:S-adenosylmethionine:tRNA ribosyltransferase-isomerase [Cyanobacteria bacterium REEB65]